MRVVIVISYDGTNYAGWQRQKNGISVQEVIETAIFKLTGEKLCVTSSGRTDAGVHAKGQVAHFDTQSTVPANKFYLALNSLLPGDIRILKSFAAPEGFHARYTAKRKTYEYTFYVSETTLPLYDRFATRVDGFNPVKAQTFLDLIEGTHDFKCFLSSGSEVKSTVRTIYGAKVFAEGDFYKITVTGNGFLYNMVRIIAGTALAVSDGKISVENVKTALLTGDRNLVGKTAPAKGLTLLNVDYSEN